MNNIVFKINHVKANYSNDEKYEKYKERRKFYSSNQAYDFMNYVDSGIKNKPVLDFVKYVDNKEKSKGVFSKNGELDKQQMKDLRNKLRNTKSPIWHGFISFEEEFGKKFCNDSESAINFFNNQFPKFLTSAGFDKNNITWFAGLHENTEHRHIHFAFFENEPTRYSSKDKDLHFSNEKINNKCINKAKIDFEMYFYNNKTKLVDLRNDILKSVKNVFYSDVKLFPTIARKLELLSKKIPKTGSLNYESENMQFVKNDVEKIVNYMLSYNKKLFIKNLEYTKIIEDKDSEILRICKENKIKPNKFLLADKYKKDLQKRLCNIVINYTVFSMNYFKSSQSKRYMKMQKHKNRLSLIEWSMKLSSSVDKEIMQTFKEYMEKLDQAEYKRLKEQEM